jgi:zinc protease
LYGKNSPQAWLATPETVAKITFDRLKKFHAETFTPDHLIIGASSPLDFEAFLKLIDPYMKDWQGTSPQRVYPTQIKKEWQPSLEFIHKDGNQSALIIGHFGEKRFNPDKYKLILANEILGGATFGSLLGDRIRTELGLAYTINSLMAFNTDYGQFRIATQTKSESTWQTVAEIKNIISSWVSGVSLTQQNLDQARDRILNRLVFESENLSNIVAMRLLYDYYGYPPNYLAVYRKEIESVTLEQVKEVLPRYFFPDQLKVLVVGDKTKIPDFAGSGYTELPLDEE